MSSSGDGFTASSTARARVTRRDVAASPSPLPPSAMAPSASFFASLA